jgi:hypothetical protein
MSVSGQGVDTPTPPLVERSDEMIVSESSTPIVRAGYSNLLLVIALALCALVVLLARDAGSGSIVQLAGGALVALLIAVRYARSVARIRVGHDSIVFTCAVGRVTIPLSNLEHVRLSSIGASMMASIETKERSRWLSRSFHYVADRTNWGSIADSQERLQALLESQGVALRPPRLLHRPVRR